jgi:hypothetical protein
MKIINVVKTLNSPSQSNRLGLKLVIATTISNGDKKTHAIERGKTKAR